MVALDQIFCSLFIYYFLISWLSIPEKLQREKKNFQLIEETKTWRPLLSLLVFITTLNRYFLFQFSYCYFLVLLLKKKVLIHHRKRKKLCQSVFFVWCLTLFAEQIIAIHYQNFDTSNRTYSDGCLLFLLQIIFIIWLCGNVLLIKCYPSGSICSFAFALCFCWFVIYGSFSFIHGYWKTFLKVRKIKVLFTFAWRSNEYW